MTKKCPTSSICVRVRCVRACMHVRALSDDSVCIGAGLLACNALRSCHRVGIKAILVLKAWL